MPPKNMISVTKNTHIPMLEASRCCSRSEKWWRSTRFAMTVWLFANRDLLRELVVVVGFPGHHWGFFEVKSRRWGGSHPFQPRSGPRIVCGQLSVTQRPQEVNHR